MQKIDLHKRWKNSKFRDFFHGHMAVPDLYINAHLESNKHNARNWAKHVKAQSQEPNDLSTWVGLCVHNLIISNGL
jgi:hypothetical protein